jgi:Na+/proline symporter
MGYTVMTIGPWFSSFVGVFMGIVGVSMLANEDGEAQSPANPFTAILEEVMNLGGFAKGAGVIAVTASLAAIMSTADSLIIAISQLVTVEIIYPLKPRASPTHITWCGRLVSLLSVVVALCIG